VLNVTEAANSSIHSINFESPRLTHPDRQYRQFGEDVQSLANNLDILSNVLDRAKTRSGSRAFPQSFEGLKNLTRILGNFRETLDDCEKLLDNQASFEKRDGFVQNIVYYQQVAPEVQILRDRIAFHNIKVRRRRHSGLGVLCTDDRQLSTALKTLEM
jgi:hypothetical protein